MRFRYFLRVDLTCVLSVSNYLNPQSLYSNKDDLTPPLPEILHELKVYNQVKL